MELVGESLALPVGCTKVSRMAPEDGVLLLSARCHFVEAHRAAVLEIAARQTLRWEVVYSAAVAHGVAPLVYVNLARCSLAALRIPPAVVEQFRRLLGHNLTEKQLLAAKLAEVLAFFHEHHLDVLLVKGAALDLLVYAPYALTTSQDVDLVLRARLTEVGKAERAAIASATRGYPLEYDFYEHHDITLNGALPVDFDRIWRDAIQVCFEGQPAWVMCPEDLLITACINACRKRFHRLKALCDIAEVLQTYPELDWQGVARRAHSDQCHAIVYAALTAANMLLNARLPAGALDLLKVAAARAAAIRFLIQNMPARAWTAPLGGVQVFNRNVNLSLLLPYMTYGWDQAQRKLLFVWHSRKMFRAGAHGR